MFTMVTKLNLGIISSNLLINVTKPVKDVTKGCKIEKGKFRFSVKSSFFRIQIINLNS